MELLTDLGNERDVSESSDENSKKFIQIFVYGGKETEELVDTRIRNYDALNIKTTQSILPDPTSLTQHIRRANLQCYYWKCCVKPTIEKIEPTTSGWVRNSDNALEPLWFEGPQFPEVLRKKSSRQNKPTKPTKSKSAVQSEVRPQRFSSLVAKYALQDLSPDTSGSDFSDNADVYSSYESESFGSETIVMMQIYN